MSKLLDEATRLESVEPGRYRCGIEVGPFWGVATPHGGYLMALALTAMQREIGDARRRPRMLSQQFLGLVAEGEAEIEVVVERVGRAVTSARAILRSGGSVAGVATGLFSVDKQGPVFVDEPAPVVPPPGEPDRDMLGFGAPVHDRFDFHRRFGAGGAQLPVEDGGWVVSRDAGSWDHRLALVASDVWVPPIIRHPDRLCATPSLHHVAHFGADVGGEAAPRFLVRHALSNGGGGITDEDIALWDERGRLLLRARQLRSIVDVDRMLV